MRKKTFVLMGVGLAGVAGGASAARAANETAPMMQYLGYTALWQQYGASLANGSNVPVSIAEAWDSNAGGYYPNTADGRFAGKTMTQTSTFTQGNSGHATGVGSRFFGNDTGFSSRSVVPNVQNIQMYSYSEFNGSYFKTPGIFPNTPVPYGSPNNSRVSSHAYGENDSSIGSIARLDYTVQRDDYLHVADSRQFSTQGNSMNSVVVAPAGGNTIALTTAVGSGTPYVAGRTSPNVTGPLPGAGSDSVAQTAGIVTLLMSRGKTTTSHHSYTTAATTAVTAPYTGTFTTYAKAGYTVNSGDTSEVVKAALMAGAHRNVATYVNGALTVPGITNYRGTAAHQAANGLDTRYGAGMVNAYNSYKIVDAGERDSVEDGGLGQANGIGQYGFDYDPSFGGANASNAAATYRFQATADGEFFATLAWNLKIAGGAAGQAFDATATLHNLDLSLVDLTTGLTTATSASTVDNTENLWTNLVAGHSYALTATANGIPFEWDYGLAWRSTVALEAAAAVPEPGGAVIGTLMGLGMLARRRR